MIPLNLEAKDPTSTHMPSERSIISTPSSCDLWRMMLKETFR